MSIFNRNTVAAAFAAFLAISLIVPSVSHAATTPSVGTAATFAVLADTYTNTVIGTTLNGNVGYTTGPATVPTINGTTNVANGTYGAAGTAQGAALAGLAAQACTFNFAAGPINLSTDITHGPAGVYAPGVYCSTGAMNVGGPLTLNGSGTYIFRAVGALTSSVGAVVTLAGASACDVFWTPTQATTRRTFFSPTTARPIST